MQVKINNPEKLKEISKKMHKRPEKLVNDTIDALSHLPASFESEAMKLTFRNALLGMFTDAWTGKMLNEKMYENLGKGDYFVSDISMDFEKLRFGFELGFSAGDKKYDIDGAHLQVKPGWAVIEVSRSIKANTDPEILSSAEEQIEEDLAMEYKITLEQWDEHISIKLETGGKSFSDLPDFDHLDGHLHHAEKILRTYLKSKPA